MNTVRRVAIIGGNYLEGGHIGALANGPATVLPLALFAWSARRLPLSTIGFIQFLAPTLQVAVGVWAGEQLTGLRIASFGFIWGGAAVMAALVQMPA